MQATLLVELLTEELPPKSLRALSEAFAEHVASESLAKARLADAKAAHAVFATPRRLAVLHRGRRERTAQRTAQIGASAARRQRRPQQAVAGFAAQARRRGVAAREAHDAKGEVVVARVQRQARCSTRCSAGMRERSAQGAADPEGDALGRGRRAVRAPGARARDAARRARRARHGARPHRRRRARTGHRFHGPQGDIARHADDIRAHARRGRQGARRLRRAPRARSSSSSKRARRAANGRRSAATRDLLDEVTALVELPSVYAGGFEAAFLEVPQECLILTMRQNQKYFPLFDARGQAAAALPDRVATCSSPIRAHIVGGNERVVRPRLEDARFFYDQDRKTRLEARVPQLAKVVYHNKLGTPARARRSACSSLAGEHRARSSRPTRRSPSAPRGSRRPTCSPAWSASFPSCRASWAATTRCTTASRAWSPTPSSSTTGRASPAIACRTTPSPRGGARRQAGGARRPVRHRPAADRRQGPVRPAPRRAGRRAHPGRAQAACPLSTRRRAFAVPAGSAAGRCATSSSSACAATCASAATPRNEVEAVLCHDAGRGSIWCRSSWRRCARSRRCPRPTSLAAANKRIAQHPQAGRRPRASRSTRPSAQMLQEPAERALFERARSAASRQCPRSSAATTPAT